MFLGHREDFQDLRGIKKDDPFCGIENEFTADGLFLLAVWFQQNGDVEKAIGYYHRALKTFPGFAEAHYNLGCLYYHQKNWSNAIQCFQKALNFNPHLIDAAFNLAVSLKAEEQYAKAVRMYEKAICLNPRHVNAHFGLGICLQNLGDIVRAAECFRKTIELKQDHAEAWFYLGGTIQDTPSMDEALHCFAKAVELRPDWPAAHHNLAVAMSRKQRLSDAIYHVRRALELSPDFPQAQDLLFRLAQHACDWSLTSHAARQLDTLTENQLRNGIKTSETPMISIRRNADPQINVRIARNWSQDIVRQLNRLNDKPVFNHCRQPDKRIRIGYLSSDFKDHAVAHQIRGMLAAHDRNKFEVFGYACNPEDGTRYRRLLSEACDQFRDVHALTDVQAAHRIHQDGIHILVDLSGHSKANRMAITALRPAPVQVSYLGFLSSSGADFIDYVIADAVVVPEYHLPYYSEKVIYLPHCYQVNDDRMPIAERTYRRSECNLPEDGVVYCCFNQPYKIDQHLFNTWMRILKQVDGSVLWLLERSALARENLCRAAADDGVDPDRLIFAGFVPIEQHLARLRLADLVLDTRTYNGGATTANALWAGVPVVTLLGNHWVSRMSASALYALGLPELVSQTLSDYQRIAVELGRTPAKRTALRCKLNYQRNHAPLFNTQLFTSHIESAFSSIWDRYCEDARVVP